MRLLLGALRLYVYRALWYWLGITSAGRALVKALGSPDENIRSIAGILLVKSGKRAEALLLEAVEQTREPSNRSDSSRIDRRPGTHPATSTIHERSQSRRRQGSARSAKSNRVLYQDLTQPNEIAEILPPVRHVPLGQRTCVEVIRPTTEDT